MMDIGSNPRPDIRIYYHREGAAFVHLSENSDFVPMAMTAQMYNGDLLATSDTKLAELVTEALHISSELPHPVESDVEINALLEPLAMTFRDFVESGCLVAISSVDSVLHVASAEGSATDGAFTYIDSVELAPTDRETLIRTIRAALQ